ncbi:hypothetical protein BDC45DRAFT_533382 [Circinella umbellata]|nr:hypothetical protein BDC45DRAFT_533382 [Circinella umbellata]
MQSESGSQQSWIILPVAILLVSDSTVLLVIDESRLIYYVAPFYTVKPRFFAHSVTIHLHSVLTIFSTPSFYTPLIFALRSSQILPVQQMGFDCIINLVLSFTYLRDRCFCLVLNCRSQLKNCSSCDSNYW